MALVHFWLDCINFLEIIEKHLRLEHVRPGVIWRTFHTLDRTSAYYDASDGRFLVVIADQDQPESLEVWHLPFRITEEPSWSLDHNQCDGSSDPYLFQARPQDYLLAL